VRAPDQLRQRVAWALSQIFGMGKQDRVSNDAHEVAAHFQDILARHAFGDYAVLLREVTYSTAMGVRLTYRGNRPLSCLGASRADNPCGKDPDENYAREVMQLFTIGAVHLAEDGTALRGADGQPIEAYGFEDVVDGARVFTGLQSRPLRGNLELNQENLNYMDAMQLRPNEHDAFPKMDLHRGHLGDGHPLCHAEPGGHFLRRGAAFRYLGRAAPVWHLTAASAPPPAVAEGGALHAQLCGRPADADPAGGCDFRVLTELAAPANCTGPDECAAAAASAPSPRLWRVPDGAGAGGTAHFEYLPPPCVELAFFGQGREAARGGGGATGELVCLDPALPAAGAVCCAGGPGGPPWLRAR